MKSPRSRLFFLVLTIAISTTLAAAQASQPSTQALGNHSPVQYGNLPLSFEPNLGQTAQQVQWLARGPQYTLFLDGHDAVLELNSIEQPAMRGGKAAISSSVVRMNLLGAKAVDHAAGEELQSGKSNYFTGRNPANWQRNVPMYGKVRLAGVYPGIDLVYYGRQGQLEYDFVVAPGADPTSIRWGFDGVKPSLTASGDLLLPIEGARKQIRLDRPVVYQMKDGVRQPVESRFVVATNEARFELGAYDKSRDLVIDPTLVFMGALGTGNQQSVPIGMALDADNEMVLTGITNDLNYPTTSKAYETSCQMPNGNGQAGRCGASSGSSAFVTKISADGTHLVYSTYLHGGNGYEQGDAVAIDSAGNAVILGQTSSDDFPVTPDAYQSICMPYYVNQQTGIAENCDGYFAGGGTEWVIGGPTLFIAKLSSDGSTIVYATFFGGTAQVYAQALALDSSDNMYFIGYNQAAWATSNVYPNNGNQAIQFPLTSGAFQSGSQGQPAATLSELSADGKTLLYSTFLAVTQGSDWTLPYAVAVGPLGYVAVGGITSGSTIPTTEGSIKPACATNPNSNNCVAQTGFLSVFDPTQEGSASLIYSTYIGGTEVGGSNSEVFGLAWDPLNNLYVTGTTTTADYPTTPGVFQTTCKSHGCNSGFLSKLDLNNGSKFAWSTYFGGTNSSQTSGNAISFDDRGWVYLYGYNNGYSWDLPVVNPIEALNGSNFAFVAAFSADAKQLLFSTPVFESPNGNYGAWNISNNGFALDSDDNIYVAGQGNDGGNLPVTMGTYATTATSGFNRGFFAKVTKVLGPVATNLTVSPLTQLPGESVTFTATIAPSAQTTPVPTGTVTVINNNTSPATTLGTITLGSKGSGSFTSKSLGRGQYSVIGNYSGDANYETGSSVAQTLTINQFQPRLTVTASTSATLRVDALSVTVTAAGGSGNPVPTGTITLSSGSYSSMPATLSNGVAKIAIAKNELPDGTITLLATYMPDAASIKTYRAATGSVVVKVEKTTQTIHFAAPPATEKYGVKPIKLSATATSGLAVTFTVVAGRGKISGDELTITGAGTLEIAANQAGNASFKAAVSVTHKIVVEKVALTVKANNLTMKQGGKVPTLTYSLVGLVGKDSAATATTGKPKLTTTASSSSKAGSYPIDIAEGSMAARNYILKFVNGTMTVMQ